MFQQGSVDRCEKQTFFDVTLVIPRGLWPR
jgi:hypothetical protein